MPETFDETRLTAYVLGELSEAERAEVEARLAISWQARQEVEEIREAAAELRAALASPAAETLAPAQRAAVLAEAHVRSAPRQAVRRTRPVIGRLTALAALLLVGLVSWRLVGKVGPQPPVGAPSPLAVAPPPPAAPASSRETSAPTSRPTADPRLGTETAPVVAESLTVEAKAPQLQTTAGAISRANVPLNEGDKKEVETISIIGRNPVELLRILPGAAAPGESSSETAAVGSGFGDVGNAFSVNGARNENLGVTLDGADLGIPLDGASLRAPSAEFNTSAYDHIRDNPFVLVSRDARSTFSVDVDTASYAIVRRFLNQGSLPPKDAVRIEELVNYFEYDYPAPRGRQPFAVHLETARCPWQPDHRLVRIALKGRELSPGERPQANLVFLLDVSGSMAQRNKLPLAKQALRLLLDQLAPNDSVAIVVYAGAEGLALPATPAFDKATILRAIESLSPGGTTHGSAGLRLAYEVAQSRFVPGGVNRVILATDGDFNVGVTNQGDLVRLIEDKARGGVFLTALGFGMDNLKDSTIEKLADHGNGNYAYIDSLAEARKVLVRQATSTLVTIAKDVKLQLEFNPAAVKAFRLIGYENRVLAHQDFNDDRKDAGDIGAGHTVTALYEIVPAGTEISVPGVDPLKYQQPTRPQAAAPRDELLTLKLRYKQPDRGTSALIQVSLNERGQSFEGASTDFRFAASVAAFGMVLRDSPYKGTAELQTAREWAETATGADAGGFRAEFLRLIDLAQGLPRPD